MTSPGSHPILSRWLLRDNGLTQKDNVHFSSSIIIIIIYSYSKSLGQWYSYLQVLIKAIPKYTDHSIKTSFYHRHSIITIQFSQMCFIVIYDYHIMIHVQIYYTSYIIWHFVCIYLSVLDVISHFTLLDQTLLLLHFSDRYLLFVLDEWIKGGETLP